MQLPESSSWRFDVDGGLITSRPGFWLDVLLSTVSNGAGVNLTASGACNVGKSKYTLCLGFAKDDLHRTLDRARVPLASLATVGLSREGGAGGMTIGLVFLNCTEVTPSMLACHQQLIHEAYTTVKGYSANNPPRVSLAAKHLPVSGNEIQSFSEIYRERLPQVSVQHGADTADAFQNFRTFFILQHGNRNVLSAGVIQNQEDSDVVDDRAAEDVAAEWCHRSLDNSFDLQNVQSISLSLGFQLSVEGATIYSRLDEMEAEPGENLTFGQSI